MRKHCLNLSILDASLFTSIRHAGPAPQIAAAAAAEAVVTGMPAMAFDFSDAFVLPGITPVQQVKPPSAKDAAAAEEAEDTGAWSNEATIAPSIANICIFHRRNNTKFRLEYQARIFTVLQKHMKIVSHPLYVYCSFSI